MKDISREAASLYDGVFWAYEFLTSEDGETGIVSPVKSEYITEEPCRLSFQLINENIQSRFAGYKNMTARLFTSASVTVKDGSFITVSQNGRTYDFVSSGEPAVYLGHQEVVLKIKNAG
ncbi:MAG: hypothetical protein LIO87_06955 [Eubacterium sp.]|nr:hypothetical protein [Eubacterium sp.]